MNEEFGKSTAEECNVFVYGTLKPGEANHDAYCKTDLLAVQEAMVLGELYDLPLGYPALAIGRSYRTYVCGFLLTFANSTVLALLDELEDYHPEQPHAANEYVRASIEVFSLNHQPLGWAWTYYMPYPQIQQLKGRLQLTGRWSSQL